MNTALILKEAAYVHFCELCTVVSAAQKRSQGQHPNPLSYACQPRKTSSVILTTSLLCVLEETRSHYTTMKYSPRILWP